MSDLCQYLEWDSAFFGKRIGRFRPDRLTPETVATALAWVKSEAIDCLYFLANPDDAQTARLADANHFRFVDIRLTLERKLNEEFVTSWKSQPNNIRPCKIEDIPALKAIARLGHHDSRFYFDGSFPVDRCDALYETWIEKSCHGAADVVLVADIKGKAVGYISCLTPEQNPGQIGLMGVDEAYRGRGIGPQLMIAALNWFRDAGVTQAMVVTQGRNVAAQRLYQRCGFVTQKVELWHHLWLT